jgi:hypothetical protein
MTREDLRLKLQSLLTEFDKEHGLSASEIHTIATTMVTLVYSDKSSRLTWYREMQKVADMISKNLKEQGEMILAGLNLSEEEKKELKKKIEAKIGNKNKKVEN